MTRSFTARHPGLARALATTLVALAALLATVWVAPRASGAAATWIRTPSVRLHTLTPPGDGRLAVAGPTGRGAGAPITLDAGMRFSMAGVTCDAPAAGSAAIRLRTSLDGAAWGAWLEAPLELAGEGAGATAFTDAVWTGPARYVQVAAASAGDAGPETLSGLHVVAIDPTEDGSVAARVAGAARRLAATVSGVTFDSPAGAATAAPVIVTRAQWGADESLRNAAPSYAPVKMAFVHHTASGNLYSSADAPALVRGIYAYHTQSLHWNDIAYNFLIDRFGTVYEGRYGGVARGVVGAHVYGFNTGSTGVSVMGTFIDEPPPAEAVTSLERLLAWKLGIPRPRSRRDRQAHLRRRGEVRGGRHRHVSRHRRPPAGQLHRVPRRCPLRAPAGDPRRRGQESGHGGRRQPDREHLADQPQRRRRARRRRPPRGPHRHGGVATRGAGRSRADGRLLERRRRERRRHVARHLGDGDVPDGAYTVRLTATPAGGEPAVASTEITVDTTAPRLAGAEAPGWFSPNGDGQTESAAVTYTPAEACDIRVGILGAGDEVVRWLHGWRARGTSPSSVTWDGKVGSGSGSTAAPDGEYRFDVERRDAAGNVARRGVRIVVDRTVGFPTALPGVFSPGEDGVRDTTALKFKLTRKAAVTVRILAGADVLRTLSLGTLAAGTHSATWDGKAGSGEYLASSRPSYTVTAVSALGETSVRKTVIVDLYRPRLYATPGKAVSAGTSTRVSVKAADPFSAKVDVSYAITDAGGRRVASGHPGWQLTGQALSIAWRPTSRGVFTVTYRAVDLAGNPEAAPAITTVTVR